VRDADDGIIVVKFLAAAVASGRGGIEIEVAVVVHRAARENLGGVEALRVTVDILSERARTETRVYGDRATNSYISSAAEKSASGRIEIGVTVVDGATIIERIPRRSQSHQFRFQNLGDSFCSGGDAPKIVTCIARALSQSNIRRCARGQETARKRSIARVRQCTTGEGGLDRHVKRIRLSSDDIITERTGTLSAVFFGVQNNATSRKRVVIENSSATRVLSNIAIHLSNAAGKKYSGGDPPRGTRVSL